MSKFILKSAQKPRGIDIHDNFMYFTRNTDDHIHEYIEYDNNKVLIKDILYSIESFYLDFIHECGLMTQDDNFKFELFKECENSINSIHKEIIKIYTANQILKKAIDDKKYALFHKNIKDIVYETSITGNKLGPYMIQISNILKNDDISFVNILKDFYEYELSQIDKRLINITIDATDNILILNKSEIEYTVKYYDPSDSILNDITYLYIQKIYEYIRNNNYNEDKLIKLYNALNIDYVKIIIDDDNYKLHWIFRKLHTLTNAFIPRTCIDDKLYDLVQNNEIVDKCIIIKYNTDSSDKIQMNTYLIDTLHANLHTNLHTNI